jgi:hypothetical protein
MSDSKSTRADGADVTTSADVRFPASEGGVHTYRIGDQVTFRDKYQQVHTGPIDRFERYEGKVWVIVRHPEGYGMLCPLVKVLPAEHPRAVAMARPVTHLACGTVVRVKLPRGKSYGGMSDGDLGVVLADKIARVNVAKLGGSGDSYGRFSHDVLTVVTVDPRTGVLS